MALSAQQIIERGFYDAHIRISGIRQCHRLIVAKEKTAFGNISCLVAKTALPEGEMLKVADEVQLPVKSPKTIVFPKGKGPNDFIEQKPEAG